MSRPFRLTIKSQVTVPKDVRDALGIKPGDDVAYQIEGDSVRLLKSKALEPTRTERIAKMRERLAEARKLAIPLTDMTTDDYMAMIREPVPIPGE